VIVLGGGPAGSHLALRLARLGRRVALVEARTFPRAKPCGEFMSPGCLGLLAELDLLQPVREAGACRIARMELHGYGRTARGGTLGRDLGAGRYVHGLALRREVLDEISLRAAARRPEVTLFEGRRAVGLLRDAAGGVVGVRLAGAHGGEEPLRAAFTVGADGLRSLVARSLGVRRELAARRKLAFVCRFRGVEAQSHAEVHFVDRGYFIAAPVDDGLLTLNFILEVGAWPGGVDKLAFLRARCAQAPALAKRLRGAQADGPVRAVGPLAATTTRQAFDGAALVGDACGFVDPLTGEGLYYAMRGAALLAPVLHRALADGRRDRGAIRAYERARRRELGPRTLLARALQGCVRRPALAARLMAFLASRPRLLDLVLTATGDAVAPRRLLDPGVLLPALLRRSGRAGGSRLP
jgi:flavin-dependent dehydrogenase